MSVHPSFRVFFFFFFYLFFFFLHWLLTFRCLFIRTISRFIFWASSIFELCFILCFVSVCPFLPHLALFLIFNWPRSYLHLKIFNESFINLTELTTKIIATDSIKLGDMAGCKCLLVGKLQNGEKNMRGPKAFNDKKKFNTKPEEATHRQHSPTKNKLNLINTRTQPAASANDEHWQQQTEIQHDHKEIELLFRLTNPSVFYSTAFLKFALFSFIFCLFE